MRRFTRADLGPDGARVLKVGAVVAVVTFALVLGAWRVLMSDLPSFAGAAAGAAVTVSPEATMARAAAETFAVPVPSYVTPSLTAPLGPMVPEEIDPQASAAEPEPEPPPAAPAPPVATPTPQPDRIRNLHLGCNQNKNRIVATLSFFSAEPVAVSLSAGQHTESSRQGGAVRMRLIGQPGPTPTCSAVVDGRSIGPVRG